ncbi:MAG: restriction endonuclease [Proteobacteria bacterium]|nr:restriction endonuclease [Pseudomonadota bacterium]
MVDGDPIFKSGSVLDYSDYIDQEESETPFTNPNPEGGAGNVMDLTIPLSLKCKYCGATTKSIDNGEIDLHVHLGAGYRKFKVFSCDICGWWEIHLAHNWYRGYEYECGRITHTAILRRFDPCDLSLPVDILSHHLTKHQETIYHIAPRKMEELVQSVLSDFFDCEVSLVGKSGDGGVDLLLLHSDKPTVIQVKRRQNPNSKERVHLIREVLGATLLSGYRRACIVSTAYEYTEPAKKTANSAVESGLLSSFELIDAEAFFRMLNCIVPASTENWHPLLENLKKKWGE